jgi:hypothetical protein
VRSVTLVLLGALWFVAYAEDVTPRIGAIEIYGAGNISRNKIRAALGVAEGGLLPASKGSVEEKLEKIPGIVASRLEAACCLNGRMILYVGIEEKGARHLEFRPDPDGDLTLPRELANTYSDFLDAINESIHSGETGESLSSGFSLMQNPQGRKHQREFIPLADKYLDILHRVIRTSRDPEQRAMAAYILQYGPRGTRTTQQIIDDLQYALQDIEGTVRANAIRALSAMYVGLKVHPEENVAISPTWFVELLNSISWSDRHNAAVALVNMTEDRKPDTLRLIRERALTSLVEMARWRDLGHALPGFILIGRISGMREEEIQDAWVNSDHEATIKLAMRKKQS